MSALRVLPTLRAQKLPTYGTSTLPVLFAFLSGVPTVSGVCCAECKQFLDLSEFQRQSYGALINLCKKCKNAYKNRLKSLPGGAERNLLNQARCRAKKHKIPFDLKIEDIKIPTTCPVLGIPLARNLVHVSWNSPTLDKLIPSLGYIKGNISVISHRANTLKNDATLEELKAVSGWVEKRMKECHLHNAP